MTEPNTHDLARQVAVLEERMETVKAELGRTLADFRADMARRDKDMADFRTGITKDVRTAVGTAATFVIVVLGLLIAGAAFFGGQ